MYFKEGFYDDTTNECEGDHYVQIRYINDLYKT